MSTHIVRRRLAAGVAVVAIAGAGLLVNGVASAAPPAGTFTLSRASGSDISVIEGTTDGTCNAPGNPGQPVDGYNAVVTGPGAFAANPGAGRPDGLQVVPTSDLGFSTTDPIHFILRSNFRDLAQELGTPLQPGDYVVTFRCVNQFDGVIFQTFSATFTFTGGPPATAYTVTSPVVSPSPLASPSPSPVVSPSPEASPSPSPVVSPPVSPGPSSKATTTTLNVFPNPSFVGLPEIFLVHVTPATARGTVQFMDGTTAIGNPVPVFGGFALLIHGLPKGEHSLTAVFSPNDTAKFDSSTSSTVSLTIFSFFSFF